MSIQDDCNSSQFFFGHEKIIWKRNSETATRFGQSTQQKRKIACRKLLLGQEETESDDDENNEGELDEMTVKMIEQKRRKISQGNKKYMDASLILDSVALVEHLWSMSKQVLSDNRKRSAPLLVEPVLFLKVNHELWDLELVCKAIAENRE